MNKDITAILDSLNEEETALLLEGIDAERMDGRSAERLRERVRALSGTAPAEKTRGVRFRMRPAYIAAACVLLIAAMIVGAVAYAEAEAKTYNEAVEFFQQNNISLDGLSRGELKAVYKDICDDKFENEVTEEVLITNINRNNVNATNIGSNDYYSNFTGRELWSMFNMSNSLCDKEWMMTERELFLIPAVLNYYQGAALICSYVPGVSAELVCDNACIGNMAGPYAEPGEVLEVKEAVFGIFIGGGRKELNDRQSFAFDGDRFAVRIKLKNDQGVVGYALVCFWGVHGTDWPGLDNSSIVKAVMLSDPITDEEADRRLDEVYNEKVVAAGLYETEQSLCEQWNDWNERNKDWYWDVFYHIGRWWEQ